MYELREGKKITLALMLYEILREQNLTLKTAGEKLGISPQGAANYMKELEGQGFVKKGKVTKEGVEFLHQTFRTLQREISGIVAHLNIVLCTDAIAEDFIRAGETVSLYMKKGLLCAGKGGGEAKGVAVDSGKPGDIVRVKGLSGIVEIKRGKIRVVVLDTESTKIKGKRLHLPEGDVYAAYGLRALNFLQKAGHFVDIRFCVPEGCVESAAIGLDVVCVLTKDLLPVFLKGLKEGMQNYGEVDYEIHPFKE
ncbi:MAG: hypothetical protein QXJ27_05535 [Thermoplasmata archaeon]